jgi:hypothetical protein
LERRTSRGGKDSVDHPPGSHDDVANAAAGALVLAENFELNIDADESLCGSRSTIGRELERMDDLFGMDSSGEPMAVRWMTEL